jgi:hypothetical protein
MTVPLARALREHRHLRGTLAGHAELGTTQRYMHLSPAALDSAIRLLDGNLAGTHEGASANGSS